MNPRRWLPLAAALLLGAAAGRAEVKPAAIFQDGMVLQRGMPVPVWGRAEPGERVTVTFAGQSQAAAAGPDGKWLVRLAPLAANAVPQDLTVAGSNTVALHNVVVGEVWLASGQSNMGFSLKEGVLNKEQEIAAADFPLIREFGVGRGGALAPAADVKGGWQVCTPLAVGEFSAVAYFFARELHQTLKVPVGIVRSAYGGTPAEAWTSREALDAVPELRRVAATQIAAMQALPADVAAFPAALAAWEEKHGVADSGNEGVTHGWAAPDLDTADWKPATAGFTWAQVPGAKGGGVFWVRKEVNLPESAAGKGFRLTFGYLAEECHTAYFNGVEVGRMDRTPPDFYTGPREANIPGGLVKAGRNVLAFRFVSHTEKGGFYVPGRLMQLPVADPASVGNGCLVRAEREFPPLPPGALESRPRLNIQKMQRTPAALYNAMIHPLIPFALRGAIWYQGEDNANLKDAGAYYRTVLTRMVLDWRGRWGEGDFPFYLVQLANYSDADRSHQPHGWPLLRESQAFVARTVPNACEAVTIDLGSATTIHPPDKQDVGKRLAALALARTYGLKDVPFTGPVYRDYAVEGGKVRVRFEPGSGPLMIGGKQGLEPAREAPGGKLAWFEVAGEDRKFAWAEARLDGDSVVVSAPEVPRPVAVRYGWAQNPAGCNLYNRAGLPTSPFRTDDWDDTRPAPSNP